MGVFEYYCPCFLFLLIVIFLFLILIVVSLIMRKPRTWIEDDKMKDIDELRRRQIDVAVQEELAEAIFLYRARDKKIEDIVERVDEEMQEIAKAREAESTAASDFDERLELRRRLFIEQIRKNAFKTKEVDDEDWSVTLEETENVHLGMRLDPGQIVAELETAFPKMEARNTLPGIDPKERVRVALDNLFKNLHLEGYDNHVDALINAAIHVCNDGENVLNIDGKPFFASFPLCEEKEILDSLEQPEDVHFEDCRWTSAYPETPYKLSYKEVMSLSQQVYDDAANRHRKVNAMPENAWSKKMAKTMVETLTKPPVLKMEEKTNFIPKEVAV